MCKCTPEIRTPWCGKPGCEMPQQEVEELVEAALSPHNVGQLKKLIEKLDPEMPVFRFQYGNLNGMSEWKRKETWKQWVKRKKMEQEYND